MSGSRSPLDLLHPDGAAEGATVLGRGCPAGLVPGRLVDPADRCDLVILAPSSAELRAPGWLERAVQSAAAVLTRDGLAYVLVPQSSRRRTIQALTNEGLSRNASFAHLPSWDETRYLVPLAPLPASYALSSLIPVRPSRRRLALAALAVPGGAGMLGRTLSFAGIAVQRPDARLLCEWIYRLDGSAVDGFPPVVTASSSHEGSFVLHRFSSHERGPTAVVKLCADGSVAREVENLSELGPAVRDAHASIPDPLVVDAKQGRSLVLESAIRGRSAAVLLRDTPHRLREVHELLTRWLEHWNSASVVKRPLTRARVDRELLERAQLLAPLLEEGEQYLSWLNGRCSRVIGAAFPFVATHNDLTMSNVFIADSGALGIVDWERGRPDGLPLVDFLYSATDAAAATGRYEERLQPFINCFGTGGRHTESVRSLSARLANKLGLSSEFAEFCFHACWLNHAANEHQSTAVGAPRPFLEILRWVVRERGGADSPP